MKNQMSQGRRHWEEGGRGEGRGGGEEGRGGGEVARWQMPPNNFDNALFDFYKLGKMLKSINSIGIVL